MPVPDGGSAARAAAGHARRDYAGALGRDDPRDPPHPEVISVMAWYGIKIASHRSRAVCPADLARASLVLAISRENLRHAGASPAPARPSSQTDEGGLWHCPTTVTTGRSPISQRDSLA